MVKTLPGRKTTGWIDDQERAHLKEINTFTTNHSIVHILKTGIGSPCPWLVLKSLRMPRAQYCSCRAVFFAEIRFKLLDFNYFLKYLCSLRCRVFRWVLAWTIKFQLLFEVLMFTEAHKSVWHNMYINSPYKNAIAEKCFSVLEFVNFNYPGLWPYHLQLVFISYGLNYYCIQKLELLQSNFLK